MNRLFRVLASCLLAVVIVLGSVSVVASPAHAQSQGEVRIQFNSPTRLMKGVKYIIPGGQTTETPTLLQFQNKNVSQSATVALFYATDSSLEMIPPNTFQPINKVFTFNGSQVSVQNSSMLENNEAFLTVTGIK